MQGFPVHPAVKIYGESSSFDRHLEKRCAARTVEASGNSMPVPLMAITCLYSYLVVLSQSILDNAPATSPGASVKSIKAIASPSVSVAAPLGPASVRSAFRNVLRGMKRRRDSI